MAFGKTLNIVSICLRMNVLLMHKITLNPYVLHLRLRQPQCSFLLLALLIIDNDDLFPHSWQPPVSLVLFSGNSIRNAAFKALCIFSLCSDNFALKHNMRNLLQRQAIFEKNLHRVQQTNDEKCFLLGTEIADTQKSVEAIRDVIDARLNATEEAICQLNSRLIIMSNCMSIQRQFEIMVDKDHNYMSYLDLAYMHLKSYHASSVSYKTSMYSAVSSLSSGFVPPNFLTPE